MLGLWSLEERRNIADLIEIFKMITGFFHIFLGHISSSEQMYNQESQLEVNEEIKVFDVIRASTSSRKDLSTVGTV